MWVAQLIICCLTQRSECCVVHSNRHLTSVFTDYGFHCISSIDSKNIRAMCSVCMYSWLVKLSNASHRFHILLSEITYFHM